MLGIETFIITLKQQLTQCTSNTSHLPHFRHRVLGILHYQSRMMLIQEHNQHQSHYLRLSVPLNNEKDDNICIKQNENRHDISFKKLLINIHTDLNGKNEAHKTDLI